MTIDCACDLELNGEGYYIKDDFDFHISDKDKNCQACGEEIKKSEYLYIANTYELDEDGDECEHGKITHCEKCGDMAANLLNMGFCFDWFDDPVRQWKEYLEDH